MAVVRQTLECYPLNNDLEHLFSTMYGVSPEPPEPQHEKCKGGESYPGVIDGWFCPCPCHRKTVDQELKDAVL